MTPTMTLPSLWLQISSGPRNWSGSPEPDNAGTRGPSSPQNKSEKAL